MNSTKLEPSRPSRRYYSRKQLFGMLGWSWIQIENVGWWIREEWFERIAGPHGLKWKDWSHSGLLKVIKDGPLRTVYHVPIGDSGIYIKHYRVPGLRSKARQWIRGGKARNEGDKALQLAAIGIPTINPIALGEERKFGLIYENYLVTEEIEGVEPLDKFLEQMLCTYEATRVQKIRRLINEELARLCARLHKSGLLHGDFHPGNLLIKLDENDHPLLVLIDLDALRHRGIPLRQNEIRDNLAQLNNYFWSRSSRAERFRFLENYLKYRRRNNPLAPVNVARFARDIETATRTWAERLWRRWAKRGQSTNKYYKTVTAPSTWAVLSRKIDRDQIKSIVDDPERLIYAPDAVILKHSRSSTVAEVTIRTTEGDQRVVIKKIPTLKPAEFWFGWARSPRAWRAWNAAGHLVARGIPTPLPLAYIAKGSPGTSSGIAKISPAATFTILERPAGMVCLSQHMEKTLVDMPLHLQTQVLLNSVDATAKVVRHMHEMSVSHRDMKAANILVRLLDDGSWREMVLIDLVGVSLHHPLPHHLRVKNLARLAISFQSHGLFHNTIALRFIRAYLPLAYLPRKAWKQLWLDVQAEVDRKIRRNTRSGRPLS